MQSTEEPSPAGGREGEVYSLNAIFLPLTLLETASLTPDLPASRLHIGLSDLQLPQDRPWDLPVSVTVKEHSLSQLLSTCGSLTPEVEQCFPRVHSSDIMHIRFFIMIHNSNK